MTHFVYVAMSLDGYIATSDGGVGWLDEIPNPSGDDYGYAAFMKGIDALLIGRNSFEKLLTFDGWFYDKPVMVASNSLEKIPDHLQEKAFLVRGSLEEVIQQVHDKGHDNIYLDGGMLVQSCLRADLVDQMILTQVPILLGEGIPLFGSLDQPLNFRLVSSVVFNNHLVQSHFQRNR